ncbi:MAG: NADH-quinone oxidoreductase subunit NuoG [Burkholderiaceae bacterium]
MVEIEIDGKTVEVPEGSMVMHAANKLGIFVPHFCYHKKLSIAANCRMCLVEVEKAPKPMPACATPVSNGMKVHTHSPKAVAAQKSVMEFLLINHPLDCPICDQGGECLLQDLSVGYGGSKSRYDVEKRVVFHKPLGPLISAEEMTRCIHCTRCVRFGQEVAGIMELGMAGRGEHSEIMSFVGQSVDSEVSGNMIDICPVGALTSKPFRYSARTWELSRRRSVSPHDSLGANIVAQVKQGEVLRVVPMENESINECWLSDRDRFSYEGLRSEDRLTRPMVRRDGQWQVTDWRSALDQAALSLGAARVDHGGDSIGALAAPFATFEELYLTQKLVRGLGSDNVDFRLRQTEFGIDEHGKGAPWLGLPIADLSELADVLLVGSTVRKDHPLIAVRLRVAATQHGLQVHLLHAADDDLAMPVASRVITGPQSWRSELLGVLASVLAERGLAAPAALADALSGVQPSENQRALGRVLCASERAAVLLGNAASSHPQASDLLRIAAAIGDAAGCASGVLGAAANSVGGYLAGATPRALGAVAARALAATGRDAARQLDEVRRAYLLLHADPATDFANGAQAMKAFGGADAVVALTSYTSPELLEVASVLLPVAPFTETAGSFVNAEGRLQSFNGVVMPLGETRPAWKVLRVLANLLEVGGFDYESVEDVRAEALLGSVAADASGVAIADSLVSGESRVSVFEGHLSNQVDGPLSCAPMADCQAGQLQRLGEVPIYAGDPIVRRAPSLQATRDARRSEVATLHPDSLAALGLTDGDRVLLGSADAGDEWTLSADVHLAPGVVRVPAAVAGSIGLGTPFGPLSVRKL